MLPKGCFGYFGINGNIRYIAFEETSSIPFCKKLMNMTFSTPSTGWTIGLIFPGIVTHDKKNRNEAARLVNTSRNESFFLAKPACMAGVLSVLPNLRAVCGRTKLK